MKNHWKVKKLSEICTIKTGKKDVNEGNPDGKYPFFTCAREHTYSNEYSFDTEAILIAGNGDVGQVSYYKGKFEAYQRTYVLFDFTEVIPQYLFIFLNGYLKDKISKQKLGNTMPYIKMAMIADFEIPIPTINEQEQIIKKINKFFKKLEKIKENTEKNLKNSKELFKSYLNKIFSNPEKDWEERTLKELCISLFAGGDVPKGNFSKIKNEKFSIPIYANGIENKGLYGYTNIEKVKDISITISARGTIGYSEIRNETFYPIVRLIVAIPNTNIIDPVFLYYITKNFKFSNTGSSIPQLTIPMVKDIKISYPKSLNEQKIIVKKIDQLSEKTKKLEEIYKNKIENIEELKKSILHKAFNGEL